jgi:hypothetical protein
VALRLACGLLWGLSLEASLAAHSHPTDHQTKHTKKKSIMASTTRDESAAAYSLWLMPERGSAQWTLLGETMAALRQGEQASAPAFPPHLTLLGSVRGVSEDEIKQRVRTLAHSCGGTPIRVWAGDLGKGSTFHQCVFLHAKKTPEVRTLRPLLHGHCGGVTDARLLLPQQQLLKAYTHAQQAVGTSQPCSHATFMPHVSLLYADIEDAAKDRLISQLQVRGLACRRVCMCAKLSHPT